MPDEKEQTVKREDVQRLLDQPTEPVRSEEETQRMEEARKAIPPLTAQPGGINAP